MVLIGSHVERADPLEGAKRRGAQVVQVHLSAPQQWRAPSRHGDEAALADSGVPFYVHAPYLINAASVRPELRARSARCLQEQLDAAADIGAAGVVVHGGHPTGAGTFSDGVAGWLELFDRVDVSRCRVLIENTAGGRNAVARHLPGLTQLFDALRSAGHHPGFVLDTCHAFAAGLDMETLVADVREAVGTIDLVHANDSRDPAGSGRDRHANIGAGHIGAERIAEIVAESAASTVVETPGGVADQAADIELLRELLR